MGRTELGEVVADLPPPGRREVGFVARQDDAVIGPEPEIPRRKPLGTEVTLPVPRGHQDEESLDVQTGEAPEPEREKHEVACRHPTPLGEVEREGGRVPVVECAHRLVGQGLQERAESRHRRPLSPVRRRGVRGCAHG